MLMDDEKIATDSMWMGQLVSDAASKAFVEVLTQERTKLQQLLRLRQAELAAQWDEKQHDLEERWAVKTADIHRRETDLDVRLEEIIVREAQLEKHEERMNSLSAVAKDKVRLNIGGQLFTTSKQTLMSEANSLFYSMMRSGTFEVDEDGEYFIDRNPQYFAILLDYLRKSRGRLDIDLETLTQVEIAKLHDEIDFYQIHSLKRLFTPNFLGIQRHVDESTFVAWKVVYSKPFSHPMTLRDVKVDKEMRRYVAVGAKHRSRTSFEVIAVGHVAKAFVETEGNSTTADEGVHWYCTAGSDRPGGCWGFSDSSEVRLPTSTDDGNEVDAIESPNRLCWPLSDSLCTRTGGRMGTRVFSDGAEWIKVVMYSLV